MARARTDAELNARDLLAARGLAVFAGAETPQPAPGSAATAQAPAAPEGAVPHASPAQGEPPAAGQQPAGGQQPSGIDAVAQRMDEVLQRVGSIEQRLPAQQQQGPDPSLDPYQAGLLDQQLDPLAALYAGYDPQGQQAQMAPQQGIDPQLAAQQQQMAAMGYPYGQPGVGPQGYPGQLSPELGGMPQQPAMDAQAMQQAVQQAVAPLAQAIVGMQREHEAEGFLQDYPQYNDQAKAQELNQHAQEWLGQLGQQYGGLSREPAFLELVHLASQTEERARAETPPGNGNQQPVSLEQPGASPQGGVPEQQPKLSDQVKAAQTGDPFWTGGGALRSPAPA